MADPRARRPQPRGAVEALAADVAADPTSSQHRISASSVSTTRRAGRVCWHAEPANRCNAARSAKPQSCRRTTARWCVSRCGTVRPVVCQNCGSGALSLIRPGVSRLREEIEAAAGRPAGMVTGDSESLPDCDVLIGTEAVLHRAGRADVVAFLDLDAELLAPRYRAGEQAMTLLARAARLVGGRQRWRTAAGADVPAAPRGAAGGPARRSLTRLPRSSWPVASCSGSRRSPRLLRSPAPAPASSLTRPASRPRRPVMSVLLRAPTWDVLGGAIAATPRPKGSRLRIEVDPPR